MSNMSAQEQLMLELINRARMDPAGEAKRFHIGLNEGVSKGDRISAGAKEVLAGNDALGLAATEHSQWMLQNDKFDHIEKPAGSPGFFGKDPFIRIKDKAGYDFTTAGENISFRATTANFDEDDALATQFIIQQHKDLFVDKGVGGRGHRTNILNENFQEIGIGHEVGKFKSGGTNFNANMVTQDFGAKANQVFVTGVLYHDTEKNDNFFSIDEEETNISVTTGGGPTDQSGLGGGYELLFAPGVGDRNISFGVVGGTVAVGVTVAATNIKLDVVNGNVANHAEVWTDSSITGTSTNVAEIHALGIRKVHFDGADVAQAMYGNKAANILEGNGGDDTLVGGRGKDELHGGTGSDTFIFDDGDTGKTKADTIVDFVQGADTIDLELWDADSTKKNNQDFEFIGTQKFHKDAGELRFMQSGGDTFIQGDTNGDGKVDFVIHLNGPVNLTSGDFDL